jgi:amino acid transporter
MLAASLVSMAGFCAASAMVSPRYVATMADHGMLPKLFGVRTKAGTPGTSIVAITVVASSLALVQGYAALVDVANVAVFAQYLPACIAVVVLRQKRPHAPRRFWLPFGPLIPCLAALVSVGLLVAARPKLEVWLAAGAFLVFGLAAWGVTAWVRSRGRKT